MADPTTLKSVDFLPCDCGGGVGVANVDSVLWFMQWVHVFAVTNVY